MKITLICHFIRYIYENYMKIYWNTFIQRNRLWFQLRPSEYSASLSNSLLVWIVKRCRYPCLQFIFGVAQNCAIFSLNCTEHIIIKSIVNSAVKPPDVSDDRRSFLTVKTVFFWLCGRVQSSVARRRVFQQSPSRSRSALTSRYPLFRPPCWVWSHIRRWI